MKIRSPATPHTAIAATTPRMAGKPQRRHGIEANVTAQRQKRAMRHVEHVERAVDQRQPDGRDRIHGAEREAGGDDLHENVHAQPPR